MPADRPPIPESERKPRLPTPAEAEGQRALLLRAGEAVARIPPARGWARLVGERAELDEAYRRTLLSAAWTGRFRLPADVRAKLEAL